jgi:hypothetical protein
MKYLVLATSLVLATTAFAREPTAQAAPRAAQGVTNQAPSFGDDTTGPTNPRGQVQSPDWV